MTSPTPMLPAKLVGILMSRTCSSPVSAPTKTTSMPLSSNSASRGIAASDVAAHRAVPMPVRNDGPAVVSRAFESKDQLLARSCPDVTQTKPAWLSDEAGDVQRPVLLVDVRTIIVRNVEELAVGRQPIEIFPAREGLDSTSRDPWIDGRLIRPRNNFFARLAAKACVSRGLFKTAALVIRAPLWPKNCLRGRPMPFMTLPPSVQVQLAPTAAENRELRRAAKQSSIGFRTRSRFEAALI